MRGVPKSNTVPEPVLPVLKTPWVLLYPCGTLSLPFFRIVFEVEHGTVVWSKVGDKEFFFVFWIKFIVLERQSLCYTFGTRSK